MAVSLQLYRLVENRANVHKTRTASKAEILGDTPPHPSRIGTTDTIAHQKIKIVRN